MKFNFKMKILLILGCVITFISCTTRTLKTKEGTIKKIEAFKEKQKFVEDSFLHYPGIGDESMRPILSSKINAIANDFKKIASSDKPSKKKYQDAIGVGLKRFSDVYLSVDTEDRERICLYVEELMDIVGLKSSNGQLNDFMYGFQPDEVVSQ
ncbi:uncharacterized protein DUF4844 [Marinifilum flexuosum]|uniref:Uncharacterized protein DUF4844 n=2 Tax=Marinifilum flexuosum TaxID=1117708 RepID=A0A419WWS5_9BACT|nr:uncharacterized protein DUF4844 [Marinifilum flexuosum]